MHVVDRKQFRLMLNSTYAFIEYSVEGNIYNLFQTKVPEEYRGRGIAEVIAEKTFKHIIAKKGKIVPTCGYLRKFYKKNKKLYGPHVVDDE